MNTYQEHPDFTFVYSKICYKLLFDENAEYEQDELKTQCFQANIKVRLTCLYASFLCPILKIRVVKGNQVGAVQVGAHLPARKLLQIFTQRSQESSQMLPEII